MDNGKGTSLSTELPIVFIQKLLEVWCLKPVAQ